MLISTRFIIIFLLTIGLIPFSVYIFNGVDGPLRVILLVFVIFLLNGLNVTFKKDDYYSLGLTLSIIFITLIFSAYINTFIKHGANIGGLSNFLSYLVLFLMAIIIKPNAFNNFMNILYYAINICGFIIAVYVFYAAISHSTFFVGLLRYDESLQHFNMNHLAQFQGLAIVNMICQRNKSYAHLIFKLSIYSAIFLSFIMLASKTASIAVVLVLGISLLKNRYYLLTLAGIFLYSVVYLFIINISYIYNRFGLILDEITSGRTRLWYYASNSGVFEYISSLFERDDVFIERTIASGHDTYYLHSSYVYYLLHTGLITTIIILIMIIVTLNRTLKSNCITSYKALIIVLYIALLGIGEQPMEFQKYGALFYFLLFYLITRNRKIFNNS